jgi:hypothetical protein
MLARAQEQTADDAAFQRVERNAVKAHQAIRTSVIADTSTRAKGGAGVTPFGFDRLDGLHRLRSGAHRQLRPQAKISARLTIDAVMRRVGIGDALIPAHSRNPCRRRVKGVLCRGQHRVMAVNVQLTADCAKECFAHKHNVAQVFYTSQTRGEAAIPPPPKVGVSLPHSYEHIALT